MKQSIRLSYEHAVRDKNQIWFSAFDHNGLYIISNDKKIQFL